MICSSRTTEYTDKHRHLVERRRGTTGGSEITALVSLGLTRAVGVDRARQVGTEIHQRLLE